MTCGFVTLACPDEKEIDSHLTSNPEITISRCEDHISLGDLFDRTQFRMFDEMENAKIAY
jgi:hypothetical protein